MKDLTGKRNYVIRVLELEGTDLVPTSDAHKEQEIEGPQAW